MANEQRGEAKLRIGGKDRLFRFSLNALADVQSELREPSLQVLIARLGTADFSVMRAVLEAGLRAGGWPEADGRTVFEMLPRKELLTTLAAVTAAVMAALSDDPPAEPEASRPLDETAGAAGPNGPN